MRPLQPSDLPAVLALLESSALPASDLTPQHLAHFIGVFDDNRLVAFGALEPFGHDALLRSVATDPSARNQGHATHIVETLEAKARAAGIENVYLLTESAASFFDRLGYRASPRSSAPPAIAATAQFSQLCPASSAFLRKSLKR